MLNSSQVAYSDKNEIVLKCINTERSDAVEFTILKIEFRKKRIHKTAYGKNGQWGQEQVYSLIEENDHILGIGTHNPSKKLIHLDLDRLSGRVRFDMKLSDEDKISWLKQGNKINGGVNNDVWIGSNADCDKTKRLF